MKRAVGTLLSITAAIYTIWYMHFGVPYLNSGALSKIGLRHPILFAVWGVLTIFALGYNIAIAYHRYTGSRLYILPLGVAALGMALTLIFDFDYDIKPDYYLHCAGSLLFSVVMGITVFILFATRYKKERIFKILTILSGAILAVDLILLLIYKETGLIEAIPILSGYVMLAIANCRKERQYEPA